MTEKIYLSGPINSNPNSDRWREDIKHANTTNFFEFLDPRGHTISEQQDMLKEADGMIVCYPKEIESWQPAMEIMIVDPLVPVVVWEYSGRSKNGLDPWLVEYSDSIESTGRKTLMKVRDLITDSK